MGRLFEAKAATHKDSFISGFVYKRPSLPTYLLTFPSE